MEGYIKTRLVNNKGEQILPWTTASLVSEESDKRFVDNVEKEILNKIGETFHIKAGEVTPDNKLGVAQARCIGACGLAPAVILDNEVQAKAKPEEIVNQINHKIGLQ